MTTLLTTHQIAAFFQAYNTFSPTFKTLRVRLEELRGVLDRTLNEHCLDTPLCDRLSLADEAMYGFEKATRFLDMESELAPLALAYHFREPIRALFELHPALLEMSRHVEELSGLKQGEWETLQFRIQFARMDIEKILHHPKFIDLAMAVEEYVSLARD